MSTAPEPLLIVFDGRCGVCTRLAGWLRKWDRHGRLEVRASQEPGLLARAGLSAAEAQAKLWAVRPSGARVGGAGAALAALDAVTGARCGSRLYSSPLRPLLDRGYTWVARNRGRIPGARPWCETNACVATGSGADAPTDR